MFSIQGKKIVLTGAAGLLGTKIASALSEAGAQLFLIDRLPQTEVIARFKQAGVSGEYIECDITNPDTLKTAAEKIGAIDVLINNAAYNPKVENHNDGAGTFETYPLEAWEEEIRVNLTGTMLVSRVFRPRLQPGASIINVASIYGVVAPDQRIYPEGFEKPASYGVSKAGVIALTKHLATLWGKDDIRVNAVVFGGFENQQDAEFVRRYSERVPLGRMAKPEEAAGIIIFLASDASSYATGGVFTIDGGWTAW